ncbi:hypothetical protein, partial [Pedobacter sp.]|uniref:hypothetical protein n=1 Tax=Pedobacter sp. TaxID=1411316 RepID=UPI002BE76AB7
PVSTLPSQYAKEFLGYLLEGLRDLRLLQPPDIAQPGSRCPKNSNDIPPLKNEGKEINPDR